MGRVVQYRENQLPVCGAAVLLGGSHAAHPRERIVESRLSPMETLWKPRGAA